MTDIAISVQNLSKCFQIYDNPRDRLKQFVMPRLRRIAGKASKQYFREFWALKDVSFEIKKGQTVGIIGRNGSGKSTLLQMICGTLNPTKGCVQTNGRVAALLELGSGFNPEFTGRENIYMNAAVLGLSLEEVNSRFDDIAAFADIGPFIEHPVKSYSSGMMVRLAFAVAINADPEILIVDEALSVGDELFQRKCFSRIEAIRASGATILFVSHSASTISQLCDQAILFNQGQLLLRGKPSYVLKHYHRMLFAKPGAESEVIASFNSELIDRSNNSAPDLISFETCGEYLDELEVKTPTRYHSQGGEILSFDCRDINSNKVNVVTSGFNGVVKMTVKFDASFQDVVFGFHLKSISGLEVAGLSHPSHDEGGMVVMSGDVIEIKWEVILPMNAGIFFFTFGVRSLSSEIFIDRVVDGAILKINSKLNSSAFGLFDISSDMQSSIANKLNRELRYDSK